MRKVFIGVGMILMFLLSTSIQSSAQCEGDFNADGDVDGSDLAIFAADFGRTDCRGDCRGDFDFYGDVVGSDLAVFAGDFGSTDCPYGTSTAIGPEGGTISVQNSQGDVITLEIPPNALPNSTTIFLTPLEDPPSNPIALNIFPGVIIQPHGLILTEPARLKVSFASALPDPELSMLFWLRAADFVLPIAEQQSTVTQKEGGIYHFSTYTGGQPTIEEAISQAIRAAGYEGRIQLDPFGFLDTMEMVNFLLEFYKYFATVGDDRANDVFDQAMGRLEEGAYNFLNQSIPSDTCGRYRWTLYKFADVVKVLLGDAVLMQAFQDRMLEIFDQCVNMTGTWNVITTSTVNDCDPPDPIPPPRNVEVTQTGNTLTTVDPAFGTITGQIVNFDETMGAPNEEPYRFSFPEATSSTTEGCQAFFADGGDWLDDCPPDVVCVPKTCQDTIIEEGTLEDPESISGRTYWKSEVTWDVFFEGVFQYTFHDWCEGLNTWEGTKQ